MRILIINPNSSEAMTAKIAEAARRVASDPAGIAAVPVAEGPESIEGHVDGAFAVPGMLRVARREEKEGVSGIVIACFDDTGLDALRALVDVPVVGIGEASCQMASLVARRFSVVTTLRQSVPILEDNIARYGLAHRCVRVRASGVAVLDLEGSEGGGAAPDAIRAQVAAALREDAAEGIVLGCAGMANLAGALSREFGVPVIEGVSAAVKLIEGLVSMGVTTSKAGGWAPSPQKPYLQAALGMAPL
jgi:allantoin racemase